MSRLLYNGVEIAIVKTNIFSREAVFSEDRADYLYTKFTIDVQGVINPQATSYQVGGVQAFGNDATLTDTAIRMALMQPRAKLRYQVGDHVLLESPRRSGASATTGASDHYRTDANNGPHPLRFDVTQVSGTKTFLVRFVVETSLVECEESNDPDNVPAILSHRWSVSDILDEQFLSTRIIQGKAVFRTDVLLARMRHADTNGIPTGMIPDDFRRDLFHPVPDYFKREKIEVSVLPDGSALTYTIVDKEQVLSLGLGHDAVKIEAFHTVSIGPITEVKAAATIAHVLVKVWGEKKSLRGNMSILAINIAWGRLQIDNANSTNVTPQSIRLTHALFDKYIEFEVSALVPGRALSKQTGAAGNDAKHHGNFAFPTNMIAPPGSPEADDSVLWFERFPLTENPVIPGDFGRQVDGFFASEKQNPYPPNELSRGLSLGRIAAASLHNVCTPMQKPGQSYDDATFARPADFENPPQPLAGNTSLKVVEQLPDLITRWSEEDRQAVYTDYKIDTKYVSQEHVMQAPVASGVAGRVASEFITVAKASTTKVVSWTAERIGSPPTLPHTFTGDPNDVLLKSEIQPATQELIADGQSVVYRVSGVYYYGRRSPVQAGDTFRLGHLPYDTFSPVDHVIAGANFQVGLIGSVLPP